MPHHGQDLWLGWWWWLWLAHSHGGGGQVGILVFQLPVQGQAPLLPVGAQQWCQRVDLAESGAGRHLVTVGTGVGGRRKELELAYPHPGGWVGWSPSLPGQPLVAAANGLDTTPSPVQCAATEGRVGGPPRAKEGCAPAGGQGRRLQAAAPLRRSPVSSSSHKDRKSQGWARKCPCPPQHRGRSMIPEDQSEHRISRVAGSKESNEVERRLSPRRTSRGSLLKGSLDDEGEKPKVRG